MTTIRVSRIAMVTLWATIWLPLALVLLGVGVAEGPGALIFCSGFAVVAAAFFAFLMATTYLSWDHEHLFCRSGFIKQAFPLKEVINFDVESGRAVVLRLFTVASPRHATRIGCNLFSKADLQRVVDMLARKSAAAPQQVRRIPPRGGNRRKPSRNLKRKPKASGP